MGQKQEEIALKFIGYFRETWPENFDDPLKLVTDDCYYQAIVPASAPIRGKTAIKREWENIRKNYGDQRHEMKRVGSSDDTVFTERIDYSFTNGKWVSIPLVAVFEIKGDKIVAWREYLDGNNVAQQIGMDVADLAKSLNPHD